MVQAVLVVALVKGSQTGRPHRVPVTVVAPAVVAESLAREANALPGHPFDAVAGTSATTARDDVRAGRVVAGLLVDLRGTTDVLVLSRAGDPRLDAAVLDRVRVVERGSARRVDVRRVGSTAVAGHTGTVANLTLLASVLGFLVVLAISLVRGPVDRTWRRGRRRAGVVSLAALLAGVLLPLLPGLRLPGDTATLAGVTALSVAVAAWTTMALEALAGLGGLALAALLFAIPATTLLTRTDPRLVPGPWSGIAAWTPTGATAEALQRLALFGGHGGLRPLLVLTAWLAVAAVAVLSARATRERFGVTDPAGPARAFRGHHVVRWRLRVAVLVVPVAAMLLLGVAYVPRDAASATPPLVSRASETSCLATGALTSVADLNRVAGTLRGAPGFQGADVGADVLLQDGRRLWVFGDTLRAASFDGQQFVRNSMLVIEPGCLAVVLPADHGALIPDRADGVGYWPMSVGRVERPGYDLVSVAAQRVRTTGSGAFSFENLGASIAVFVVRRGGAPQLVGQHDIGPDSSDRDRPTWGAASAVSHGWVYLYGTANPGRDGVFGFSLRVARVRPDDILDARRWTYWDGRAWRHDAARAALLIPARNGVSQTLSVFERGGTWYALSKRDDFLGTDLTIWTAPSPTGPFTAGAPLAQLPSDTATGELRYMPLAHPDLLSRPGSVVVSYSQNNTDAASVEKNPFLYRPRFLRVPLP